MKIHALECDQCGGRDIRRARLQGLSERIRAIFGVYPFRCRECHESVLYQCLASLALSLRKMPQVLANGTFHVVTQIL